MTAALTDRRRPWAENRSVQRLTPFAAAVVLVATWQLICTLGSVPEYILPPPSSVVGELSANWPRLLENSWPTAFEAVMGFAIGNGVAILAAVLFVHWTPGERAFMPIAVFAQTIPIVAIAPMLIVALGTGYAPKIVVAALISVFPTLVNMVRGLRSADGQLLELFKVLSGSRWEIFWKLRIYASLPYLFSALKISATACVIGAIIAEWIGSQAGLGYLIIVATYNFNTPLLYATMVFASAMALIFFSVVGITERRIVKWKPDRTS